VKIRTPEQTEAEVNKKAKDVLIPMFRFIYTTAAVLLLLFGIVAKNPKDLDGLGNLMILIGVILLGRRLYVYFLEKRKRN
jgi:hypothetical protein